jgi:hypothetical protein
MDWYNRFSDRKYPPYAFFLILWEGGHDEFLWIGTTVSRIGNAHPTHSFSFYGKVGMMSFNGLVQSFLGSEMPTLRLYGSKIIWMGNFSFKTDWKS